jgi:electron transport complex protein RnfC
VVHRQPTSDAARALVEQARQAGEQIHHFHGGLRLRHNKKVSCEIAVERPPLPPTLAVPVLQHAHPGTGDSTVIVQAGEHVLKGQLLGRSPDVPGSEVHAPTSGTVREVGNGPVTTATGRPGPRIVIEADGRDEWCELTPLADWSTADPADLQRHLAGSGIVGLGGAVFPTALKTRVGASAGIHTLIINGAECEPYISCDEMLMRSWPGRVAAGARVLKRLLGAERVLIAIEDQMGVVHRVFTDLERDADDLDVVKVTTIYPEGGERQLIQVLTGLEVPAGGLPTDLGLICFNVATAAAIADRVETGRPLVERIVTVAGPGIVRPRNWLALIGTPIAHLVAHSGGYTPDAARLVLGGPMMGFALSSDDNPVTKAANCVLVLTDGDIRSSQGELPCIRCGECARVCPALLLPQLLHQQLADEQWQQAEGNGLEDCIECGCCDFVCPSHIPLTDRFRNGIAALRRRRLEAERAARARRRFEARNARLAAGETRDGLDGEAPDSAPDGVRSTALKDDARARIRALMENQQEEDPP